MSLHNILPLFSSGFVVDVSGILMSFFIRFTRFLIYTKNNFLEYIITFLVNISVLFFPGHIYRFYTTCTNRTGRSNPSEEAEFKTNPVLPGKCPCPSLAMKPKSSCVTIKWGELFH